MQLEDGGHMGKVCDLCWVDQDKVLSAGGDGRVLIWTRSNNFDASGQGIHCLNQSIMRLPIAIFMIRTHASDRSIAAIFLSYGIAAGLEVLQQRYGIVACARSPVLRRRRWPVLRCRLRRRLPSHGTSTLQREIFHNQSAQV